MKTTEARKAKQRIIGQQQLWQLYNFGLHFNIDWRDVLTEYIAEKSRQDKVKLLKSKALRTFFLLRFANVSIWW